MVLGGDARVEARWAAHEHCHLLGGSPVLQPIVQGGHGGEASVADRLQMVPGLEAGARGGHAGPYELDPQRWQQRIVGIDGHALRYQHAREREALALHRLLGRDQWHADLLSPAIAQNLQSHAVLTATQRRIKIRHARELRTTGQGLNDVARLQANLRISLLARSPREVCRYCQRFDPALLEPVDGNARQARILTLGEQFDDRADLANGDRKAKAGRAGNVQGIDADDLR